MDLYLPGIWRTRKCRPSVFNFVDFLFIILSLCTLSNHMLLLLYDSLFSVVDACEHGMTIPFALCFLIVKIGVEAYIIN